MEELNLLNSLCPLNGRDGQYTSDFHFGEGDLHLARMVVMLENVSCLLRYFTKQNLFQYTGFPIPNDEVFNKLKTITKELTFKDALRAKQIDKTTNHDVK